MNIKKELVSTFRNLLSAYFGKVYSDSEIKISDRIVGGVVEIIAPDGTLSPAIDGEYLMEDGFTFTVKDGKIESIIGSDGQPIVEVAQEEIITAEDVVSPEEPSTEVMPTPEEEISYLKEKVSYFEEKVSSLEERISNLESMIAGISTQNMESQKAVETFNKVVTELNNNIKTLASVPVQFSKTDLSTKAADDRQEKMNDLVAILNSNKK